MLRARHVYGEVHRVPVLYGEVHLNVIGPRSAIRRIVFACFQQRERTGKFTAMRLELLYGKVPCLNAHPCSVRGSSR